MVGVVGSSPIVPTKFILDWSHIYMPCVTLPDGSRRVFDSNHSNLTVLQVAKSIGEGLARAAIAGRINDKLVDVDYPISEDCNLQIITSKDSDGLEIIRHSTAHLLAHAVKRLFPTAQVTIGPVIEDGFYYDFAYERAFTTDDFVLIEKEMQKIVAENHAVTRTTMSRNAAIEFFMGLGEVYKAEIIKSIPENEVLSLYQQGDFTDLCRGPHVPNTGMLKVFKLTKVAGAYWRGDAKNEMLQRIYGTAWADKQQLADYIYRIEEALKRDHRKLGKQLDLFHLQEEAPGMVFWHPKGWTVYQVLVKYMRGVLRKSGYQEINTPQIADQIFWKKSGHWDTFLHAMFTTETEDRHFAVKPMSCPGHVQVFNNSLRSYRDLPIRFSEFGCCHRKEPSGSLHGIMRVRGFVQDDGHVFCTDDQLASEAIRFNSLLFKVYEDFGFTDIVLKLSTRPDERMGTDELWDKAEQTLALVLDQTGKKWEWQPGEGAFYGPKIEYTLKDSIGRAWQLGTLQLDYSTPGRLDATYIAEDGSKKTPVMLHRAIFGTLERFLGILIEHYAGKFPVWLAPIQVVIVNISDKQAEYAKIVEQKLQDLEFRSYADLRNEKIGFKIREHSMQKVPFLLIVGDVEVADEKVTVRTQSGEDLGTMALEVFVEMLSQQAQKLGRL